MAKEVLTEERHKNDHHHHEELCGCGHDHHHEDACGCGHNHHHEDACGCGHDHHHEEHKEADHTFDHAEKQVYILENLGCAHCASKMEEKIQALPQVEFAAITFATKQLQVVTNTDAELLEEFQKICASIESEVVVRKRDGGSTGKRESAKGRFSENKKDLWEIGIGAVLFVLGLATQEMNGWISFFALIIGYLILGKDVLITAAKNIGKGHVFDENFLMGVATIAAIVIGDYKEAVGVMLFYRVGELFEDIAVARSRSQIMEAVDLRPEVVNLVEQDGTIREIPAEEAKVGDVLLVRAGDRIPLEGVVLEGESRLDTSPVTGEPVPVAVVPGSSVTSGCVNLSGVLKMRAEKVLEDSMVTRILNSVENAAASKPKIDRFITRFSKVYTPVVVALAGATAIIPSILTGDWNYWIYTAITFLVISCPCALVISIPLSFFAGIGGASNQGVLVKGSNYLETLAQTKYVVFDKTGTMTQGVFEVSGIHHNEMSDEKLLEYAALAECSSSHPISKSLQKAYGKPVDRNRVADIEEISGNGVIAKVDSVSVAAGNAKLMKKLGVAYQECHHVGTVVHMAVDGRYAGHILISDIIKPHAKEAITELKKAGISRTVMLTGDSRRVADQVASELGIDEVYSELLPADKVTKVEELLDKKTAKEKLAFVGDGINDAPVLSRADIGIAMGALGSDAAIEAADIVLMDDDPLKISKAIKIARKCIRIVYENIYFAIGIKVICLILGAIGIANMWMAIFADVGVMVIAVLNAIRALFVKHL